MNCEKNNQADTDNDAEKLKQILGVVSDRIPALLKALRDTVYSKEAGKEFGGAVASFYKELIDGGIPAEQAMEMTRGYMINLRDIVKGGMSPKTEKSAKKGKKKGFVMSIGDKEFSFGNDEDDEEDEEEETETEQDRT
ncbi:hypothetical protein LR021_00460 [Candidatus Bipolaricaulota bacterium]|nr:hypothetical protein [Candidatus Bipolaricaulota bacterium]